MSLYGLPHASHEFRVSGYPGKVAAQAHTLVADQHIWGKVVKTFQGVQADRSYRISLYPPPVVGGGDFRPVSPSLSRKVESLLKRAPPLKRILPFTAILACRPLGLDGKGGYRSGKNKFSRYLAPVFR